MDEPENSTLRLTALQLSSETGWSTVHITTHDGVYRGRAYSPHGIGALLDLRRALQQFVCLTAIREGDGRIVVGRVPCRRLLEAVLSPAAASPVLGDPARSLPTRTAVEGPLRGLLARLRRRR